MIDKIDLWLGILMGAGVFLWPDFALDKYARVTQKELAKISPEYVGINAAYLVHGTVTMLIALSVLFGITSIFRPDIELRLRQAVLMVFAAWPFSSFALSQGIFAVRKGVYPASKFFGKATTYVYAEDDSMREFAHKQILVALGIICLSIVVGLVRWFIGL